MIDLVVREQLGQTPVADLQESFENASVGSWVFALAVSCLAAYVSWSCNTVRGISVPMKIINSSFAFIFGALYLIFYGIFVSGYCGA